MDKGAERAQTLLRQGEARTDALMDRFVYWAAQDLYQELLKAIPKGPRFDSYRKALEVSHVGEGVYTVRLGPIAKKIRGVDGASTALYVQPRRRAQSDPSIQVLERYSPWTWDTLPFLPKKSQAKVVSRTVREREVATIGRDRKADKKEWEPQLRKLGVRIRRGGGVGMLSTTRDLAFDLARVEKGLSSGPMRPHWRPSLLKVLRGRMRAYMVAHADLRQTLSDPKYTGWKQAPGAGLTSVTPGQARDFVDFQKSLGY